MAKGSDVLLMLIPTGGWVITGDDFDSIQYDEGVTPLSKKEFLDGFNKVDAWKADQDQARENERAAILNRLGITAEEVALILG
jgi:hypothetical protein